MANEFQILQRRFGDARPGLQLVAVENAAIPVTVLRADVLAQEKKELPIAEEFTLRFVNHGINTPEEISAFLGLDPMHVLDAAAAQLSENTLRRTGSGERLALTPLGMEVARNLAATRPVLRQLPVGFDRLTWTLVDYPERTLIEKRQAEEEGMIILPAAQRVQIGINDVTASGFNSLLKGDRIQVLRIHKVAVKKHRYLPVQLLVYGDQSRHELQLAVCIDDDLSAVHGLALDRVEAVKRLGLKFGDAPQRPVLDDELESLRTSEPLPESEEERQPGNPESTSGSLTSAVRSVSVFEHPALLAEALSSAKKRLLIISPWVKTGVVNTDFVEKLEKRLRAGVAVTIAYGIGDDSDSHEVALRRLRNLAARFDNFAFVRVKNTHAKILIFDGQWVTTSFNWLSFRGDSDRTYRMEEGTLISVEKRVDIEYERFLNLIDEQRLS